MFIRRFVSSFVKRRRRYYPNPEAKKLKNINDKLLTIQSFQKENFEKIHENTNDIYNYIDRIDTVQKWTAFMVLMTYMYSKH
jgi:hypothetical protein